MPSVNAIAVLMDGAFAASCLVQMTHGSTPSQTLITSESIVWKFETSPELSPGDSLNPRVAADAGKTETGPDVTFDPNSNSCAMYVVEGVTLFFSVKLAGIVSGNSSDDLSMFAKKILKVKESPFDN